MRHIFRCLFLLSVALPFCARAQNIDAARLFKQDSAAVVLIISQKSGSPVGQGSGALVSADGKIVSALHIMKGADSAVVKLRSGTVYDAVTVVAFDEPKDLIVLKVSGSGLPTLPLGNSDVAKEGDRVAIISNTKEPEGSITQGTVGAVKVIGELGFKVIKITGSASEGSSGGAIVNASGELIAIHSSKLVDGENLNFGIPANDARSMLDSHGSFPLAQLTSRLAGRAFRAKSQLERASPTDISGEWKSESSGNRFKVRLENQHAYVEWLPSEEQKKLEFSELCDLKAEKDTYKGTCKLQAVIRWEDGEDHKEKSRECRLNAQIELMEYNAVRVEGRTETKGLGQKWTDEDNSNCGERFPVKWSEFVWVRPR